MFEAIGMRIMSSSRVGSYRNGSPCVVRVVRAAIVFVERKVGGSAVCGPFRGSVGWWARCGFFKAPDVMRTTPPCTI